MHSKSLRWQTVLVSAALFWLTRLGLGCAEEQPSVRTKTGRVLGLKTTVSGRPVYTYLGIPYARPPVGSRRFRAPEPIVQFAEDVNATEPPPSCHQLRDRSFMEFEGVKMWNPNTPMSEDCLYLNVWTPRLGVGNLAVMVWIYGGGFSTGTSTLSLYDGVTLAATQDVVVASMNYRVGPLGFLRLDDTEAPGNMGLSDQQLALRWIHENINYFGGNKDRITLFGESAGAVSVSLHLLAPASHPYFQYAIMQSGAAIAPWVVIGIDDAVERAFRLAKELQCADDASVLSDCRGRRRCAALLPMLTCLRRVDADVLTELQWSQTIHWRYFYVPFPVVVDGRFLLATPAEVLERAAHKLTSILIGSNDNEGTYFLIYGFMNQYFHLNNTSPLSKFDFDRVVSMIFKDQPRFVKTSVLFHYDQSRLARRKFRDVLDDIVGDYEFICPVVNFADRYATYNVRAASADANGLQPNKVWMYHFRHRSSRNPWPQWMGVMHGYEIEFVFGDPIEMPERYHPNERDLSNRMMTYWANFAKTGNPNTRTLPNWPEYQSESKLFIVFNTSQDLPRERSRRHAECTFWNRYIPQLKQYLTEYSDQQPAIGCQTSFATTLHISIGHTLALLTCRYLIGH